MPAQQISKPNLLTQPLGSQLLCGLVYKYAGQAFDKMRIRSPFEDCEKFEKQYQ